MQVSTRKGDPLPYTMQSRGQPLRQFAVIECSVCHAEASFPWSDGSTQNPIAICQKFTRMGWEIYRTARRRCPKCKTTRTRQKATFARLEEQMQTPKPHVQLVKTPVPARRDQTYLLTIDGTTGAASIKAFDGAQEMIFGDKSYLVIPLDEASE